MQPLFAIAKAIVVVPLLLAATTAGATQTHAPASVRVNVSGSGASASAPGALTSPLPLERFGPLYMGSQQSYTATQAVALAQEFTVIAQRSGELTPYIAQMKVANPSLRIVAYMNGAFDQSTAGNAYPTTWYAHDAAGRRIQSAGFGNWLMDPSASWASSVAGRCTTLLTQSKYDGCFLDTMGMAPLLPGYDTGLPINPATGAVYTTSAWIASQSSVVAAVEHQNPTATVVTNGLANGPKYYTGPTSPLLATSKIAMAEIWLRASSNPATKYPTVTAWKQDVDMLAAAESNGLAVMVTTKLWTSATSAQADSWHKFALSSFLLGAGGHCAFNFSTSSTDAAITASSPWDTVNVGYAAGPYSAAPGGLYVRTFTHGFVVVNPGSSPVTITFAKPYVNLNGLTVTSESIGPETGDVLVG